MNKQSETWTVRRLMDWTARHLASKRVDQPRLATEMLLAHVMRVPRLKLYMDPDRPATDFERAEFRGLVERAARHEPVDYLVGHTTFFAMELRVTPAVLVPRPSTETVVEHVLQHSRRTPGFRTPRIADVGTGSGCIAVALARHLPEARVVATDLHADALELAKLNAQEQGVANRVEFRMGDLLAPLQGERFHYLVSNPPYISDAEWLEVDRNVKDHEPVHALRGGRDGLDLIRPLIAQASRHLLTPGQLVLEVAAAHKETVLALALDAGLRDAHVLVDHERLPRVLVANW